MAEAAHATTPETLINIGEIISLAAQSELHRGYSLAEIEARFLVPASQGQFRMYRSEVEPFAVITWALVTDDLHAALLENRQDIPHEHLRSGDNLWITDAIIRPEVYDMVFQELTQAVFPNKIGHMWTEDESGHWKVETYFGANRQGNAKARSR